MRLPASAHQPQLTLLLVAVLLEAHTASLFVPHHLPQTPMSLGREASSM